jgi:hypothetical protein
MRRSQLKKFGVPAIAAGVVLAATAVASSQAKESNLTLARIEGTKIAQNFDGNVGNSPAKDGKSAIKLAKGGRGYTDPAG